MTDYFRHEDPRYTRSCILPITYDKVRVDLPEDEVEHIKQNLDMRAEIDSFSSMSEERRVLEDYPKLAKIITEHARIYATEVMGIPEENELQVLNSWVNHYEEHQRLHTHTHSHTLFVSTLVLEKDEDCTSDLILEADDGREMRSKYWSMDHVNFTPFNARYNTTELERGDLIIFPADLPHFVSENEGKGERWTLSTNFLYHGLIEESRHFNELKIAPLDERSIIF